jgi:undecaprenyl-diphosphatase
VVLVLVSVAGGLLLSTLFKEAFDRPRPDLVPHGATVYTASFPSGHSMMAAVTYLTLAVMYARVEPRRAVKIYLIAVATLIILFVGASRVYLGVHWPTDVVAGWLAGATWALFCWLIARWLQRRGAVEPEAGDTAR